MPDAPLDPGRLGITARLVATAVKEFPHLPLQLSGGLLLGLAGVGPKRRRRLAKAAVTYEQALRASEAATRRAARQERRLLDLIQRAFWPDSPQTAQPYEGGPVRTPQGELAGTFASSKLSRAVYYESSLERQLLRWLDAASTVETFQEQPLAIPYLLNGHERRTYVPDVLVRFQDGRTVVVEGKPYFQMGLWQNLEKWRACLAFCRDRGWGFLVTDCRRTLGDLLTLEIPTSYRDSVLDALDNAPLDWRAYARIRESTQPTADDFLALIVRERLRWQLSPFRLEHSQAP